MIYRELAEVKTVDWGNGLSRRFLLESDGMGYTVTDTTVRAGTKSRMEYARHLEACYCISGIGEVVDVDGRSYQLREGVLYALDKHDPHFLIAGPDADLRLVCVFTPALTGNEQHSFGPDNEFSRY